MVDRTLEKVGTLEDFLFRPNNELVVRHYHTDSSLAQLFFDNLDIQSMVADKLATYAPSKVRDIIEENIRSHLLWLEVFGVLLGMLFSGAIYFDARRRGSRGPLVTTLSCSLPRSCYTDDNLSNG
jgi:hypothetical protein